MRLLYTFVVCFTLSSFVLLVINTHPFSFVLITELDLHPAWMPSAPRKRKQTNLLNSWQQEIEARNSEIAAMKEDQANQEDENNFSLMKFNS